MGETEVSPTGGDLEGAYIAALLCMGSCLEYFEINDLISTFELTSVIDSLRNRFIGQGDDIAKKRNHEASSHFRRYQQHEHP